MSEPIKPLSVCEKVAIAAHPKLLSQPEGRHIARALSLETAPEVIVSLAQNPSITPINAEAILRALKHRANLASAESKPTPGGSK